MVVSTSRSGCPAPSIVEEEALLSCTHSRPPSRRAPRTGARPSLALSCLEPTEQKGSLPRPSQPGSPPTRRSPPPPPAPSTPSSSLETRHSRLEDGQER